MNIKVVSDNDVLQEGLEVLMNHLEPSKVLRFLAACQLGKGDYLKLKEQLFSQETVASLYEQVKIYQAASSPVYEPQESVGAEELTDKE